MAEAFSWWGQALTQCTTSAKHSLPPPRPHKTHQLKKTTRRPLRLSTPPHTHPQKATNLPYHGTCITLAAQTSMTSRVQHISRTKLSPPSRDTIATAHMRSPTIRPNKNNLTQKRTSKRPRSPEHGDSQRKSTRQGRVGTPPQQPTQN